MKNRLIFIIAAAGAVLGIVAAVYYGRQKPAEAPVFEPAANPYGRGIYANGIVESFQPNGENINIFPEVGGTVAKILVSEGQVVHAGAPLLQLDDSVQRAAAEQIRSQADAALSVLEGLKAQPRKEILEVAAAQVDAARASVRNVGDQLSKVRASYRLNARSVSKSDLDNAVNAFRVAQKNLEVAAKQYQLTQAGAWSYDIRNQEKLHQSLVKQYDSATALLAKYMLQAPSDGVVLSIRAAVGSYVSPQGVYGTYTAAFNPIIVMGGSERFLQVRTYVDEILVPRLPAPEKMSGQMFIRGTRIRIPLEFVRIQPYVTPKIELSDQRQERVDVRVLPVIFKFEKPKDLTLYPGQLVDVYLAERQNIQLPGKSPPPKEAGK